MPISQVLTGKEQKHRRTLLRDLFSASNICVQGIQQALPKVKLYDLIAVVGFKSASIAIFFSFCLSGILHYNMRHVTKFVGSLFASSISKQIGGRKECSLSDLEANLSWISGSETKTI